MNSLFQTICRIGIFMICARAVIHFRPQESYEKYLKLLVSAMVLIQMFLPIGRFLFQGDSEELAGKPQAFLEELEAEMSAAEKKAYEMDSLLEQMTLEEIRRQMEAQAAEGTDPTGGETEGGRADTAGNTADGERKDAPDDTIQIERIQVEDIQVQIQKDPPGSASTE